MTDEGTPTNDSIVPDDPSIPDVVAWLRDHPDEWEFATMADFFTGHPSARRVLADVHRRIEASAALRVTRRRRWRWGIAGGAVVLATGGIAVAAIWDPGQPSGPEAGALCRREPRQGGDGFVLAPGADPIEGCREVWATDGFEIGELRDPPLTSCISDLGTIEVYPAEAPVCETLGLEPADVNLSPENQAVVDLQDRLIEAINRRPCRVTDEVAELAQAVLSESGLDGWKVAINEDAVDRDCAQVGVDSATQTVFVFYIDPPEDTQP